MKKIKLLCPILGLTSIATIAIPLTSCSNNGDEANHVKTSYSAPVVGQNFEVTFTLDNGYSLDVNESNFEFANSNGTVYLSQCVVDSTNKKVTVPGELVTSTSVKVNFKSIKAKTTTDDEKRNAVKEIFEDREDKNITFEAVGAAKYFVKGEFVKTQATVTGSIKAVKHNLEIISNTVHEGKTYSEKVYSEKASDIGYWIIAPHDTAGTNYTGYPCADYPLSTMIKLTGFDLDEFVSKLVYDSVLDTYTFKCIVSDDETINFLFTFDSNKKIKSMTVDTSMKPTDETILNTTVSYYVANRGSTTIGTIPSYTKKEHVQASDFKLGTNCLETNSLSAFPLKVVTPVLSATSGFNFDPTKTTYIYFQGVTMKVLYEASTLVYNGTKQLTKNTQYKFVCGSDSKTYFEIPANTLDKNADLKCVFNFTGSVSIEGELKVKIQQTKPA